MHLHLHCFPLQLAAILCRRFQFSLGWIFVNLCSSRGALNPYHSIFNSRKCAKSIDALSFHYFSQVGEHLKWKIK